MVYVDRKNSAGTVVEPQTEMFKAAAGGADWSKSFYRILTNGHMQLSRIRIYADHRCGEAKRARRRGITLKIP